MAKLPKLFQQIVEHDQNKPDTSGRVVSFKRVAQRRKWRDERRGLSREAAAFIVKQRSGT